MTTRTWIAASVLATLLGAGAAPPTWTAEEKAAFQELRLAPAPAAADPSNRFATSEAAAELGHRFFFDAGFSSNGKVSCASCHQPDRGFQDGTALAKGVGTTARRTMPIAGLDGAAWFFWDGRKDSLWSQALGPLESPVEHGGDRAQYVQRIATEYRDGYERTFGPLPDLSGVPEHASPNGTEEARAAWARMTPAQRDAVNRVFANMGKAIAAYERRLQPGEARFDRWVDAVAAGDAAAAASLLDADEQAGARLFAGKGRCTQCHDGPAFSNHDFANTGVPAAAGLPEDLGRLSGAAQALDDEFGCLGRYSDARPEQCAELLAVMTGAHAVRQFKVPSLRNVAERAPYMHAGQLATLEEVIDHYDRAPAAPAGESEIAPLRLSAGEKRQLVKFLGTLSAPLATEARWLAPPAAPVVPAAAAPSVRVTVAGDQVTVEGELLVPGSLEARRAQLVRIEEWPRIFADTRAMAREQGGVWSADWKSFGHPHPVIAGRALDAVRFELADAHHGAARFEYALAAAGPSATRMTVRFVMAVPPQLTHEQLVALLRAKAVADLQDFSRAGA
jgi:cytochrome c peroxidase